MIKKNKINEILIFAFSLFLAFGKFDPFGTNGLYFDALTIIVILNIALTTDVIKKIKIFKVQLSLLFAIGMLLFLTGFIYGLPYFNFKYFAAIIIFWFFSYYFSKNPRFGIYAVLIFALSCALIAVAYSLDFLDSYFIMKGGRLLIFDENPNSISARMALAFIILIYIIIENPLNFNKIRFIFAAPLPSIFLFVIATGSRGSFLIMILGLVLILLLANIHKGFKIVLIIGMAYAGFKILNFIETTVIFERLTKDDNLIGSREEIWINAIQIFIDRPFGVGELGYVAEMLKRFSMGDDTHNLFIYLLVTGGFISLLLFLIFLKKLFQKSYNGLKNGNAFLIIILTFLVLIAAKTGGVLTYLIMWYFFAVINGIDINKLKKHEFHLSPRLGST